MSALFLAAAILAEVIATMSLRASEGFTRRWFLVPIITGYLLAFMMLTLALDHGIGVGVAYGIWTATGVAITAVLSRFIFNEPLTATMVAGIGLISVGVLVVEIGGH